MNTSTILLVEDHAGFARALLQMLGLNPSLEVVAVADSAQAALRYIRETRVDLVLVDYSLPDLNGINLLETLQKEHPHQVCAMISGHISLQHAQRALEVGARGYMIKDNPAGILTGIQHILRGEIYVSDELRTLGPPDLLADFR